MRYRLTTPAEGRVGEVLLAEDTLLDRRVGLLLVPQAAAAEPARLERIRHEVERAAEFVHPGAATVYGLEEQEGRSFVTVAPAAGDSLEELLAAGGPPFAVAVEVALALSDVLASAKEAGVVHGALHPGDVRLAADGSVTVGGFGLHELRRAVEEELAEPVPEAAYRPPEAGPGLLPDHRTDLYAVGGISRRLLSASKRPDGLPAATAAALEEALDRCLRDDPALRPSSAAELRPPLEAVQRELLRGPRPEAESRSAAARLGPVLRWGLPAAGLSLLILLGWGLWGGRDEPGPGAETAGSVPAAVGPIDLAVLPFSATDDEDQTRLAVGFGREVNRLLAGERQLAVIGAGSAAAAAVGDPAERLIASRLGAAHLLAGRFVWQRDDEMSRAEVTVRLTRAEDGQVLWQETLEAFFGEIGGLQARVVAGVADRLGAGRRHSREQEPTTSSGAYEAYLRAVALAAGPASPEELRAAAAALEEAALLDPRLLPAHVRQVEVQLRLAAAGPAAEPLAAARRALTAARRVDPEHPEVHRAAGELELASGGDVAIARRELEAALRTLPGDPDLLRSIARIDRREGRWEEALEALTAASRREPLDLVLAADLTRTLIWKRRFAEAMERAERLGSLLPQAVEPALLRAEILLCSRGDAAAARAVLEALPESARGDPRWQRRMLRLDLYQGAYAAALERLPGLRLERAEELVERAWIRRYMGESRRAAAEFDRARELLDDRLEADPANPWLSSLLAQAYAGTGGEHLAARMGQRAVAQLPVTTDAVAGVELVERLARTYVLAGDLEQALDEIAFLLEIPSPVTPALLRLDPAWRPLRGRPRFRALLERFGP